MSTWTKLPAIAGFTHCESCPPRKQTASLDMPLAIGFGQVAVTRGDETVWAGDDPNVLLYRFEKQAQADPEHDWQLHIDGPLYNATYQRHGERKWVLIERGDGAA